MVNGAKIREKLNELKIGQNELANSVGVSKAFMSFIIEEKRDTTTTIAARIANVLKVKVDEIIKKEEV